MGLREDGRTGEGGGEGRGNAENFRLSLTGSDKSHNTEEVGSCRKNLNNQFIKLVFFTGNLYNTLSTQSIPELKTFAKGKNLNVKLKMKKSFVLKYIL